MSTTEVDTRLRSVEPGRPPRETDGSRFRFAGLTVVGIWVALAAASIWSPVLVSGTDDARVPIVAFTDWFYAVIATGLVIMAFGRRTPDVGRTSWAAFTLAISAVWSIVAIVSIWSPELVSGTDDTHVPVAALVSPIAGVLATAFVSVFVAGSPGRETG